jgi:predicted nucleic acid-binding Zn ribbon protein
MPTYVYKFIDSGETIEIYQAFTDDALTEAPHPSDGKPRKVKKVFTPVGITFKGGGFYKTDSAGTSKTSSSGTSASKSTDSATSPATDSGSSGETKSGSTTETKTGAATPGSTPGSTSGSTPALHTPKSTSPAKSE